MASSDLKRGEIWLASLGNARKGEPGKTRPVVIVSADELLAGVPTELVVVVPVSASRTHSPLRPSVPAGEGVERDSVAVCRGIRGLNRQRLVRRLGVLPDGTIAEVDKALKAVLALT